MKILTLRWQVIPPDDGCRWCGFPKRVHGLIACPRGPYERPTLAQIGARHRVIANQIRNDVAERWKAGQGVS